MRYLKTFEFVNISLFDAIKGIGYILEDEGLRVIYTSRDTNFYGVKDIETISIAVLPDGIKETAHRGKGYGFRNDDDQIDFLKREIYYKEYFQEYLDRIHSIMTEKVNGECVVNVYICNYYKFCEINKGGVNDLL